MSQSELRDPSSKSTSTNKNQSKNYRRQVWQRVAVFLCVNIFWAWFVWIPGVTDCGPDESTVSGTVRVDTRNKNGNQVLKLDDFIVHCTRANLGLSGCRIKASLRPLLDVGQVTAVYQTCRMGLGRQDLTVELLSNGRPIQGYSREQMAQDMVTSRDWMFRYVYWLLISMSVFVSSISLFFSLRDLRKAITSGATAQ